MADWERELDEILRRKGVRLEMPDRPDSQEAVTTASKTWLKARTIGWAATALNLIGALTIVTLGMKGVHVPESLYKFSLVDTTMGTLLLSGFSVYAQGQADRVAKK